MRTGQVLSEVCSPSWAAATPRVSVVVATHDRQGYLAELVEALERQREPEGGFEVVLVDDGSRDGTWPELLGLAARTALPLLALRLAATGGPSLPRNTGVARCRGDVLALTDDDCLPDAGWLRALCPPGSVTVVQGATRPGPGDAIGPWDRSISVSALTGLHETCNLSLPRDLFLEVGGFVLLDVLGPGGRGFGEDVLMGAAAARLAGAEFAPEATVQHRWLSASFLDHLRSRRRLSGFPLLVREVPELRKGMWRKVFLTRRTAAAETAGVGVLLALTGRRVGCLATLPLLVGAVQEARSRPGRPLAVRTAQVALADVVSAASLVEGSIRHRGLLL
ncbi:MAG: glycosyl transferase family 2 [Frankiales bacterium]|nr:glycosyl transferase family 2 [Frankiales bacterium]